MNPKKFIRSLREKSFILSGIISFFLILFGIAGAMLAATGVCFICWIPLLSLILGIFGITTGTLLDYNKYFIITGTIFILVAIYLYQRKKCNKKTCKI